MKICWKYMITLNLLCLSRTLIYWTPIYELSYTKSSLITLIYKEFSHNSHIRRVHIYTNSHILNSHIQTLISLIRIYRGRIVLGLWQLSLSVQLSKFLPSHSMPLVLFNLNYSIFFLLLWLVARKPQVGSCTFESDTRATWYASPGRTPHYRSPRATGLVTSYMRRGACGAVRRITVSRNHGHELADAPCVYSHGYWRADKWACTWKSSCFTPFTQKWDVLLWNLLSLSRHDIFLSK